MKSLYKSHNVLTQCIKCPSMLRFGSPHSPFETLFYSDRHLCQVLSILAVASIPMTVITFCFFVAGAVLFGLSFSNSCSYSEFYGTNCEESPDTGYTIWFGVATAAWLASSLVCLTCNFSAIIAGVTAVVTKLRAQTEASTSPVEVLA